MARATSRGRHPRFIGTLRYVYPAVFTCEANQEIAVVFPDLDVATSGADDNDALLSARELPGCALYGMEEDNGEIPTPAPLSDITTAGNEQAVPVDVYMPSIRMTKPPANRMS